MQNNPVINMLETIGAWKILTLDMVFHEDGQLPAFKK
jgi:hypothetical protein